MNHLTAQDNIKKFRDNLYQLFPKRSDALFNLLDAITSDAHQCDSVVKLSLSRAFERQYTSITDAIADGLPFANWEAIQKLVFDQLDLKKKPINTFILDCTGQSRLHAKKSADRHMTHCPNPAPGNKPITVGHQYSVLTMLPDDRTLKDKHWVLPISAQRVPSDQKGHECGMQQLANTIDHLKLSDQMTISVGDTLYGTEKCRVSASKQNNLVHIFRLNSKRNVYSQPKDSNKRDKKKPGRHKEFGNKMNLNKPDTHLSIDDSTSTPWVSARGKQYQVAIDAWHNMLVRGSRSFKSSKHPITVIRIHITKENGESLYKKPLWLAVFGKKREQISLKEAYDTYRSRYDIEHFFRFAKNNLLINDYQTPEVCHEENWWSFCLLAYVQLYLANKLVSVCPHPWEIYLPEYKCISPQDKKVYSPSQTQRGFSKLLAQIGTPARACVPRGKPIGRLSGHAQIKREDKPVQFKNKKKIEPTDSDNILGLGDPMLAPEPQTIDRLIEQTQQSLSAMSISPEAFVKSLLDSS